MKLTESISCNLFTSYANMFTEINILLIVKLNRKIWFILHFFYREVMQTLQTANIMKILHYLEASPERKGVE